MCGVIDLPEDFDRFFPTHWAQPELIEMVLNCIVERNCQRIKEILPLLVYVEFGFVHQLEIGHRGDADWFHYFHAQTRVIANMMGLPCKRMSLP